MRKYLPIIATSILFSSVGLAQNYNCKFSSGGATTSSSINLDEGPLTYSVGNFAYTVKKVTIKIVDTSENKEGIAISAEGMGMTFTSVAPIGDFIALINQSYDSKAFCQISKNTLGSKFNTKIQL